MMPTTERPERMFTVTAEVVCNLTDAELLALGKRYRNAEDGQPEAITTVDDAIGEVVHFGLLYGQGLGSPMLLDLSDLGDDASFDFRDTDWRHGGQPVICLTGYHSHRPLAVNAAHIMWVEPLVIGNPRTNEVVVAGTKLWLTPGTTEIRVADTYENVVALIGDYDPIPA